MATTCHRAFGMTGEYREAVEAPAAVPGPTRFRNPNVGMAGTGNAHNAREFELPLTDRDAGRATIAPPGRRSAAP
jgi:hypothetical protein